MAITKFFDLDNFATVSLHLAHKVNSDRKFFRLIFSRMNKLHTNFVPNFHAVTPKLQYLFLSSQTTNNSRLHTPCLHKLLRFLWFSRYTCSFPLQSYSRHMAGICSYNGHSQLVLQRLSYHCRNHVLTFSFSNYHRRSQFVYNLFIECLQIVHTEFICLWYNLDCSEGTRTSRFSKQGTASRQVQCVQRL